MAQGTRQLPGAEGRDGDCQGLVSGEGVGQVSHLPSKAMSRCLRARGH